MRPERAGAAGWHHQEAQQALESYASWYLRREPAHAHHSRRDWEGSSWGRTGSKKTQHRHVEEGAGWHPGESPEDLAGSRRLDFYLSKTRR